MLHISREELRAKFIKTESILFKLRWEEDDKAEQQHFMETLNLQWQPVSVVDFNTVLAVFTLE